MFKSQLNNYYKMCPSSIILLGILSSVIPLVLKLESWFLSLIFVFLSVLLLIFVSKKALINYVIWCFIGLGAFYFNNLIIENKVEDFLLKKGAYVQIRFSAFDNSLMTDKNTFMPPPKNIYISPYEMKIDEEMQWQKIGGKFYLNNKKDFPVLYGRNYEAVGIIQPADRIFFGTFPSFLRSMGVKYVFYPDEISELGLDKSIRNFLIFPVIKIRDWLLQRCVKGIESEEVKDFLSGILFGFRQGVGDELKNKFLQTGTIHIIVISGTHIGILVLLFLFLFRPLPIRSRYVLVLVALLVYIVAIGYQQSAVRAFLMVSVFMILKAFLRVSSPFNVLFFICAIMILVNPFSILNPGFLFSYTIVFALILGWKVSSEMKNSCAEKYFWKAKQQLGYSVPAGKKIYEKVFLGIASSLIASIAGFPLQLLFNGLFTPVVPLISILILPLIFPLFVFSFLKMIFISLFPDFIGIHLLNFFLEGIVKIIFSIVNLGNDLMPGIYLPEPSFYLVLIFYLSFVSVLLLFSRKLLAFYALIILVMTLVVITFLPYFRKDFIILNTSSRNMLLTSFSNSSSVIINTPADSAYEIKNLMKQNGINSISKLVVMGSDKDSAGDCVKLLESYKGKIGEVIVNKNLKKTKTLEEIMQYCKKNQIRIELSNISGLISLNYGGNDYLIEKVQDVGLVLYINGKKIEDNIPDASIDRNNYFPVYF